VPTVAADSEMICGVILAAFLMFVIVALARRERR